MPWPADALKGSPPAFIDAAHNDKLWHISFNRVRDPLILDMVSSNADAYYRYEYKIQGGGTTPPEQGDQVLHRPLHEGAPATLRASFGFYRAWDETTAQNGARQAATPVDPGAGNRRREQLGRPLAAPCTGSPPTCRPPSSPARGTGSQSKRHCSCSRLSEFLAPYHAAEREMN